MADRAGFTVGIGVRDITPPDTLIRDGRIWLWGFGSRTKPADGVHDRLNAQALVIRDAQGAAIVLVSVDLGALDPFLTAAVRVRVEREHGIPAERTCINVTHTHGAPAVVSIPTWSPRFDRADPEYLRLVEDGIVDAIRAAILAEAPAALQFARGSTGIAYDRHFGEPGFHDPTLDVLRAIRPNGETIVTACFTACHAVARGDYNRVNTDFVGPARMRIEQEFGGVALFFQAFTGISNPKVRDAERIGAELAEHVIGLCRGSMEEITGSVEGRLDVIRFPFQPLPAEANLKRARETAGIYRRWARAMAELGSTCPAELTTPIQAIRIGEGEDAWILSISAHEVTSDLGAPIRALRPRNRVTLLGFSNSQLSYLPSRRVLTLPSAEEPFPFCANYEGGVAFAWYGHRAPLSFDVDERFVAGYAALLDRAPAY